MRAAPGCRGEGAGARASLGPLFVSAPPARGRPAPQVVVETAEDVAAPWRVILFNDNVHSFEEVIAQLVKATGCSTDQATELAWRAHTDGKTDVFEGDFAECYRVQAVLQEIALITELRG